MGFVVKLVDGDAGNDEKGNRAGTKGEDLLLYQVTVDSKGETRSRGPLGADLPHPGTRAGWDAPAKTKGDLRKSRGVGSYWLARGAHRGGCA